MGGKAWRKKIGGRKAMGLKEGRKGKKCYRKNERQCRKGISEEMRLKEIWNGRRKERNGRDERKGKEKQKLLKMRKEGVKGWKGQ